MYTYAEVERVHPASRWATSRSPDPPEGPHHQRPRLHGLRHLRGKVPAEGGRERRLRGGHDHAEAICMPFPQAVPRIGVLDPANCTYFTRGKCKVCEKVCPTNAIDYTQKDEIVEVEVGDVVMATGWKPIDRKRSRNTAMGGWRTSTRTWSSSGFATRPARPTGNWCLSRRREQAEARGHRPLRRQPRFDDQQVLLERLLHGGDEVRAPRAGEDASQGVLVVHRHAGPHRGFRRTLPRGCWRKACTSSAARWPK